MRSSQKITTKTIPLFPLFPGLCSTLLSPLWAVVGYVFGVCVFYSQCMAISLCHSFLLRVFLCPDVGFPWVTAPSEMSSCSKMSLPWAAVDTSFSFSDLGIFSNFFHYFCSLLLSLCIVFYLLINTFSQRCHQLGWWAQLCGALIVEPAGTGCVWHRSNADSSHRGHPYNPIPWRPISSSLPLPDMKTLPPMPNRLVLHFQKYGFNT